MRDSVFEALRSGATLLVASQRQARTMQIAYGRRMQQEEQLAWPSPDILTWNAWLERCWEEFSAPFLATEEPVSSTLLSPVQETELWVDVIRRSAFGNELLQSHATARVAQEAWRLSREWVIPSPSPDTVPNEDARAFAIWSRDFDERCHARNWQDRARLADTLGEAFVNGRLNAPKRLLLFGFEEHTPQQEGLLEILRRSGTTVEPIGTYSIANTVTRFELAGPLEEIAAAAQWARKRLEAGASRIGIIVPDLGAMRPQVVRIFDDMFVPGAVLPGSANASRPYNLSLGQPLSQYPIVHTALQILELGKGEMACEETGSLLRSPAKPPWNGAIARSSMSPAAGANPWCESIICCASPRIRTGREADARTVRRCSRRGSRTGARFSIPSRKGSSRASGPRALPAGSWRLAGRAIARSIARNIKPWRHGANCFPRSHPLMRSRTG